MIHTQPSVFNVANPAPVISRYDCGSAIVACICSSQPTIDLTALRQGQIGVKASKPLHILSAGNTGRHVLPSSALLLPLRIDQLNNSPWH
jgi:hypothetical protein